MNSTESSGKSMTNTLATRKGNLKVKLSKVLSMLGRLPDEGVFMGLASDGLPVLLNVYDNEKKNIVVWDKLYKQGLRMLKVLAEYVFSHRKEVDVEFVVFTTNVEEWGELNKYGMGMTGNTSCIGIIPFGSELANTVVRGLAKWINEKHEASKKPVVVLVDGLENLNRTNQDFQTDFRYVLLQGYRRNVYVVGTADRDSFNQVHDWLGGFSAEIYGCQVENVFQMMEDKKEIYFLVPQTEMI